MTSTSIYLCFKKIEQKSKQIEPRKIYVLKRQKRLMSSTVSKEIYETK